MEKTKDLFKAAAKKKYRFSYKGVIGVEDLFDLTPEQLDEIYRSLKRKQKDSAGESLLQATKEDSVLSDKIEIVSIIFKDKQEAKEKAAKAAEKKAQMDRIRDIMHDKKDAVLRDKSIEELEAMLASGDGDSEE